MTESTTDIWAQWLLNRRHGGDTRQLEDVLAYLAPVRDKVLSRIPLDDGRVVLDVGCGDGLIAFAALERSPSIRLIFSDISQDLLNHAASLARQMKVSDRCQFVRASADDLVAVPDASVDAVTTRSVLIYVAAKQKAFNEFYRVLKPGGRVSLSEPINRFGQPAPAHMFGWFDATPIMHIAAKIKAVYEALQPLNSDPMMNFDERDLIAGVERAGFNEIHLDLEVEVKPLREDRNWNVSWESFLRSAANPRIPTLAETMSSVLTTEEVSAFTAHMRPLIESKSGTVRSAVAYLWASK